MQQQGVWWASAATGSEAYVTKLSADGRTILFSTYLGGSGSDYGMGIALDRDGGIYVTGYTNSVDFIGAQNAHGGGNTDAFLAKLTNDGSQLLFSRFLGGAGIDIGMGLAIGSEGIVTVAGSTRSSNFPVSLDAPQASFPPGPDAFRKSAGYYAQFDSNGTLLSASFLGGSGSDTANAVASGPSGFVAIAGESTSADFMTTPGAVQPVNRGDNPFLVFLKFKPDGKQ